MAPLQAGTMGLLWSEGKWRRSDARNRKPDPHYLIIFDPSQIAAIACVLGRTRPTAPSEGQIKRTWPPRCAVRLRRLCSALLPRESGSGCAFSPCTNRGDARQGGARRRDGKRGRPGERGARRVDQGSECKTGRQSLQDCAGRAGTGLDREQSSEGSRSWQRGHCARANPGQSGHPDQG